MKNPSIIYGRTITPNTDIINIFLDNPTVIPAFNDIDLIIKPCENPPSFKQIYGFAVRTHDGTEIYNMKYIEESVGVYTFETTEMGTFVTDATKNPP